MHKKLATDLTSLAHSILQIKNKEDVVALKQKALEVYEKLSMLAYVDEYINTTPNATETKEELVEKIEASTVEVEESIVEEIQETEREEEVLDEVVEVQVVKEVLEPEIEEEIVDEIVEEEIAAEDILEEEIEEPTLKVVGEITEQPFDELEQTLFSSNDFEEKKVMTLEEELEDTISVEVAADLFEKADTQKSLNDQFQQNIQIGLNDRIAFVKNLFNGSQEDFNRVISQLNTFKTEKEARKFINKKVKPDYDWTEHEEYEERFMAIVERKFL